MSPEKEIIPPPTPAPESSTAAAGEGTATFVPERRKRARNKNEDTPQSAFKKILELDRGHDYLGKVDRYCVSSPQDRDHAYQGLMINVAMVDKDIERTTSPVQKEKLAEFREFLVAIADFLKKYPTIKIIDDRIVRPNDSDVSV